MQIDIKDVLCIFIGKDAFELILCGAKAVQVATCHWIEGPKCFERISNELQAIMIKKGYTCIEDFRGKLKSYQKPSKKESTSKVMATDDNDDNDALNGRLDNAKVVSINTIIIYIFIGIISVLIAIIGVLISKLIDYY